MNNQIELVNVNKDAFKYYRKNVKGNKYAPYELAQRKLTRNIMLGKQIYTNGNITMYRYGQMNIKVNIDTNTVIQLDNKRGNNAPYVEKDLEKYYELNELLGINDIELNMKKVWIEKQAMLSNIKVNKNVINTWRLMTSTSRDFDDSTIIDEIKFNLKRARKLEQFHDQKCEGRQFYKYKGWLFCVVDNKELAYIKKKDTHKNIENVS